jgi:hypothetical protein
MLQYYYLEEIQMQSMNWMDNKLVNKLLQYNTIQKRIKNIEMWIRTNIPFEINH